MWFILGIHKKSQLSAICGELGRVPLAVDIKNILKYKESIKQENTLLYEALISCSSLGSERIKSWLSQTTQRQELLKTDSIYNGKYFSDRKAIKQYLGIHYYMGTIVICRKPKWEHIWGF